MGKIIRRLGIGVLVLLTLAVAAGLWLHATATEPREVPGWRLGSPKPAARGELATAVAHIGPCPEKPCPELERLYVMGGLSGLATVEDRVSVYAPAVEEWFPAPFLPAPRHHLGATGFGRDLYVSGGAATLGSPWEPENNFWRLRIAEGEGWEALEPMPEPRWGHRLVAHEGRLYVVGGQGPSSRVLIYSPGEGWSTGAEMPLPRDHLSVVVADDRIWAIGGRREQQSLPRVDVYDPEADVWLEGPDLPHPTSGAAEGVVDGVILIFGGEAPELIGGQVYDEHWSFDTGAEEPQWTAAPKPPLAVHGADGAVFQETFYIVGGASRHGVLSVTAWTDAMQILDAGILLGD